MPVDQASYRGWEGEARPSRAAPLAIAGTMIRRLMRLRLVRWVARVVPIGVCIISSMLFYLGSVGEGHSPLARAVRQGLGEFDLLTFANRSMLQMFLWFGLLMAAMAGAPLIAEDRRAKALPLYFSRPITHLDYVLGKLLTLVFFLGLVVLLPPLCIYLADVALSKVDNVALEHFPVFLRSLVPGILTCVVFGAVALGVSALTERTNQAVLLFIGLMLVSLFVGELLAFQVFEEASWRALSPMNAIQRVGIAVMPLPDAFERRWERLIAVDVSTAWASVAIWTSLGLGVLALRVRKVEVVT